MNARVESQWAKVPTDLLRIDGVTLADVQVYVCLDYAAGKRGYCTMTVSEIQAATGILSDRTVRTATAKLEEHGYISAQRLGHENRTTKRYWVLARSRPVEEVASELDEEPADVDEEPPATRSRQGDRPAMDYRSVGSELPVSRIGITGRTTSLKDLSQIRERDARAREAESPSPELLSDEQAGILKHLRARMHRDICGGSDAVRDPAYGEQLVLKGATRADIDAAVDKAKQRGMTTIKRAGPFVLACIEGAIEERRAGYERGAQAPGARGGGAVRGRGAGAAGPRGYGGGRRGDGGAGIPPPNRPRRPSDNFLDEPVTDGG